MTVFIVNLFLRALIFIELIASLWRLSFSKIFLSMELNNFILFDRICCCLILLKARGIHLSLRRSSSRKRGLSENKLSNFRINLVMSFFYFQLLAKAICLNLQIAIWQVILEERRIFWKQLKLLSVKVIKFQIMKARFLVISFLRILLSLWEKPKLIKAFARGSIPRLQSLTFSWKRLIANFLSLSSFLFWMSLIVVISLVADIKLSSLSLKLETWLLSFMSSIWKTPLLYILLFLPVENYYFFTSLVVNPIYYKGCQNMRYWGK